MTTWLTPAGIWTWPTSWVTVLTGTSCVSVRSGAAAPFAAPAAVTTIVAHQELKDATLVLNEGWIDGLTVNTIEPSPVNQASRNGDLALELGHLAPGAKYVLYMDYQVNPTTVGSRTLHLELDDGEQPVASLTRQLRIWP